MPLNLNTKRIFSQRSDRVKGVDIHPKEPWLLACLYSGHVYIWNYADGTVCKTFEVTELPVRTAKFIGRKQWLVCGADDMLIRVFNYNTMDKVKTFEAHTDYIRSIAVHPTLPYLLTSSDDMLIKLWDWDKNWTCTQVFEGHAHYVICVWKVAFNPKDTNTFASASLDKTVKVWSLGQPMPNFTLEGHEKGVNSIDYYSGGDRPYLVSGADDKTVRVWDYQTKGCVQVLEGHAHNVSAVCFHPELPIIISGSEDGSVRIWHSMTFRLEDTVNEGKERVWAISYRKGINSIAVGYDEGVLLIKLGRDEPVVSMDASGKIIWAKHNEIQTSNVKSLPADFALTNGERLPLAVKDLGTSDAYPNYLRHNRNGRFVAVCGDGEYIVYTALAWRNKTFGQADEFVWSSEASDYAVRSGRSSVKIFRNFQEKHNVKTGFLVEGIYGGTLLGLKSQDFIVFYDWSESRIIRKIDVSVKNVYWAESGDLVSITTDDSFYILRFHRDIADAAFGSNIVIDEDGIEDTFEVEQEISEQVVSAIWVGDCFVYNNATWRLNYCIGGEVTTLYHLDRPMFLLGYLATHSQIYLIDKEFSIVAYELLLSLIEYKTLVMRGNMNEAQEILETIPKDQINSVARFLEARSMLREALEVATDPDYKFELAIQIGDLNVASNIAEILDSEVKWKQLGELAMTRGKFCLAEQCLSKGKDLSGLLLLYTTRSSRESIQSLAIVAEEAGKNNIAFMCYFLLGDVDGCIDLLLRTDRIPEAGFFARTYAPSRVSEVIKAWKADLKKINPKAAESLADPAEYPNLFPSLDIALKAEKFLRSQVANPPPASAYPEVQGSVMVNIIDEMQTISVAAVTGENGNSINFQTTSTAPVKEEIFQETAPGYLQQSTLENVGVSGARVGNLAVSFEVENSEDNSEEVDLDDWALDNE